MSKILPPPKTSSIVKLRVLFKQRSPLEICPTSLTLLFLTLIQLTTINGAIAAPKAVNEENIMTNSFSYKLHQQIPSGHNSLLASSISSPRRIKRTLTTDLDQQLSDECADQIQNGNLDAAKQKLSHINNAANIDYVVKKAYNQTKENFDKILKFGDTIDDVHRRFLVYKALYNEMNVNGHVETIPLILLTEHLRFKVMNHDEGKAEIKKESGLLFDSIENAITNVSVQKITDHFLNQNKSTTEVNLELPVSSFGFIYKVVRGVIDNILEKLGTKKILSMVHDKNSIKSVEYTIAFQKAIFYKIQSNDGMKNDLIELAIRMRELMNSEAYNNTQSSIKVHIEEVKEALPKSVKNIAFSSLVCIKNTQYGEFLYAADPSDDRYDLERRYVFTLLGGTRDDPKEPRKFFWKLERRKDDAFEIINDQYNEHLFAGDPKWDDDRRCALTWTPGGSCINYSSWIFEPEGQDVYIKNFKENEYLFADFDNLHHNLKRKVFTFVPRMRTPDSKWEIVDCSS